MQTIHRHVESTACGKTVITHRVMIALGLHTRSLKNASVHIRCIHNARTQFLRKKQCDAWGFVSVLPRELPRGRCASWCRAAEEVAWSKEGWRPCGRAAATNTVLGMWHC